MAETVRLTIQTGPHKGRRFCFRGPTSCLLGRSPDCFVRFFGTDRDLSISRRHCEILVDPPVVRVRDLCSLNGTYINGQAIAETEAGQNARVLLEDGSPVGDVRSGDIITVGGTSLVVDVVDCPDRADAVDTPPWKEGEVAKEDCPVPCPADGSAPFVGCCVGGAGASDRRESPMLRASPSEQATPVGAGRRD